MKFLIALPTRSTNDPLIVEGSDYLVRLRPPMSAQAVFLNPKIPTTKEAERKFIEGKELLAKTEGYFRVVLTECGKHYSSEQFAQWLERQSHTITKMAFLIGGAYGFAPSVSDASNATLSLSPMTMPHRMAFLVLAEQVYRAGEIIYGSPYHK